MRILSWNIQAGKGVDDVVSIKRIAEVIQSMGSADIICCQEVMSVESATGGRTNIDADSPSGQSSDHNQVRELAGFFPEHECYFGAAVNRRLERPNNSRLQFGNLILSRLPVLQCVHHKLPQPATPGVSHMPRQALEVLVEFGANTCRVVTTHLDYFAQNQRTAQVQYFSDHHQECLERNKAPSPRGGEMQFAALPETDRSVYCGDFNLTVDSNDYNTMIAQNTDHELADCWRLLNAETEHAPTCGIYDHVQWTEGSHCRDYFFVSAALAANVASMEVDTETAASDHQPILLTLEG